MKGYRKPQGCLYLGLGFKGVGDMHTDPTKIYRV